MSISLPGGLWDCPLDVSALAWESVRGAVEAAGQLAETRASNGDFATDPSLVTSSFAAIDHLRVDGREPRAWAPLSGFFEAEDGWVRLHGNYPHHASAISAAFGATGRDALAAALRLLPTDDIEEAVTARGGIATVVRDPATWQRHSHAAATATTPWIELTVTGDGRELPSATTPLDGIRVLDLTRVIAGPTCSQLLGCLGADVLRIDPPHRPELLDQHLSTGMGKRSAELDLRTDLPHLREALLPQADVVLLGYRPGALAPFGLDPQDLATDRPDLVIASLSAWGESGPWAHLAGFDSIVQAATGIAVRCGTADRPGALPVQALDHATGYRMAAAVMSTLAQRKGAVIRTSLLGAARELLDSPPADRPLVRTTNRTVRLPSPHGELVAVPPPITLAGRTLERPVGGYGAAAPMWTARHEPLSRGLRHEDPQHDVGDLTGAHEAEDHEEQPDESTGEAEAIGQSRAHPGEPCAPGRADES